MMKRAATHFEQVPKVIAEKVLARQTGPSETDVVENAETVKPKVSASVPALRSRKV
jgi:hypothetical protein